MCSIKQTSGLDILKQNAAFLHVNFQHMLANILLLAVVGGLLERRYGTVRVSIVLVISTLGAAFFSGAFEDVCTQVFTCNLAQMQRDWYSMRDCSF